MEAKRILVTSIRCLISIFLPPWLGYQLLLQASGGSLNTEDIGWFFVLIIISYTGVLSIIYTVIMENLGIKSIQTSQSPRKNLYLFIGSVYWGLGSLISFLILLKLFTPPISYVFYFTGVGLIFGLIITTLKLTLHLLQRKWIFSTIRRD